MTQLILASASPHRKQLLQRLRVPFVVSPQDIDESSRDGENPEELVCRLAQEKAYSCQQEHSNASIILGSDQVGTLGSDILGKPGNHDNAVRQLGLCAGQTVRFLTAVCLIDTDSQQEYNFTDITEVRFRDLDQRQIEAYVKSEQPFGACGSFQIEGLGISLVSSVRSDDPTSLIGLPLIRISHYLAHFGLMSA